MMTVREKKLEWLLKISRVVFATWKPQKIM